MSADQNSHQDANFIRTFAIVLGILVAIAIAAIIGAGIITTISSNDDMRPEMLARIQSNTQPVYSVNTDPNATQVAASGGGDTGGKPKTGKQVFQQVCTACHTAGVAGAPKVTNTAEWNKRLSGQGKDSLYKRAINGYKGMPAKGGNSSLSDEEMHNAVDYILKTAGAS